MKQLDARPSQSVNSNPGHWMIAGLWLLTLPTACTAVASDSEDDAGTGGLSPADDDEVPDDSTSEPEAAAEDGDGGGGDDNSADSGEDGSAGTGGSSCANLSPDACGEGCIQITGVRIADGCRERSQPLDCVASCNDDGETVARQGPDGSVWLFGSACAPEGWPRVAYLDYEQLPPCPTDAGGPVTGVIDAGTTAVDAGETVKTSDDGNLSDASIVDAGAVEPNAADASAVSR